MEWRDKLDAVTGHQKLALVSASFAIIERAGINARREMAKAHMEIAEEQRLGDRRAALALEGVDVDWYFAQGNRYAKAIDGDWFAYCFKQARENEITQQVASRMRRGNGAEGRSVNFV